MVTRTSEPRREPVREAVHGLSTSDGDNLPFQLDLECLELRNSLIFDYLWIPEEVSLDLLSRSLTLSRGASGFRILDSAPCGAHLGRK